VFWVVDELAAVEEFACVFVLDELDVFPLLLLPELSG
jgi:hypothetical protein